MPALPLHAAGKYVVAAYLVFLVILLVYMTMMGAKLRRLERELSTLDEIAGKREHKSS